MQMFLTSPAESFTVVHVKPLLASPPHGWPGSWPAPLLKSEHHRTHWQACGDPFTPSNCR
jgi:hypothetical protein